MSDARTAYLMTPDEWRTAEKLKAREWIKTTLMPSWEARRDAATSPAEKANFQRIVDSLSRSVVCWFDVTPTD